VAGGVVTTDQPTTEPPTGSVAVIEDPVADRYGRCDSHPGLGVHLLGQACANSVTVETDEPTAGEQLLAELAEDEPPIQPQDRKLYAGGSYISAIALHVPAGHVAAVTWFAEPTLVDLQITCRDATAAREVAERVEWSGPVIRKTEAADDPDLGTHRLWEGHLFGIRVRVAGLEPVGGAS
jgi:hypothetical protein